MFALIWLLVSCPHLVRDLQCLLQTFKALGGWRKRHPQSTVFFFIPGGSDAEISAPVREDIQRGDGFDQQARISIGHAGDHRSKLDAVSPPGGKCQSAIEI